MNLRRYKGYSANLTLIALALLLYSFLPYYNKFLNPLALRILIALALFYLVAGALLHTFKKTKPTIGEHVLVGIYKKCATKKYTFKPEEKRALLFVVVKLFFIPIMLSFVVANASALLNQIPILLKQKNLFTLETFNTLLFPFLLAALFFIDTLWFLFGYLVESEKLHNKVKSVEPTFVGWLVALACYPPFNGVVTSLLGWHANEYVIFHR